MRQLLVICFTVIILVTLHLMMCEQLRENFSMCPPDTVQGNAYQSYNNPFKSRCFAGTGETDIDTGYNEGSNSDSDNSEGDSADYGSDNYCPYSSRANPYDSSKSNVKEWCNIPDF